MLRDELTLTLARMVAEDAEKAIADIMDALARLDVIRPAVVSVGYDHRLVGAHRVAETEIAAGLAAFLHQNDAIRFERRPSPVGMSARGIIWVFTPGALRVGPTVDEQARDEQPAPDALN